MHADVLLTVFGLCTFWLFLLLLCSRMMLSTIIHYVPRSLRRGLVLALQYLRAWTRLRVLTWVTYSFAFVMMIQVLGGTPVPVTYVAGNAMCGEVHPYCDGDAVIFSAHGSFGVGDAVLLRVNSSRPTSLPRTDLAATTQLRLRRVLQIETEEGADQWKLLIGTDVPVNDEQPWWINQNQVISAAYLRVPGIARPFRMVQRLLGSINSAVGAGTPVRKVELHKFVAKYFGWHTHQQQQPQQQQQNSRSAGGGAAAVTAGVGSNSNNNGTVAAGEESTAQTSATAETTTTASATATGGQKGEGDSAQHYRQQQQEEEEHSHPDAKWESKVKSLWGLVLSAFEEDVADVGVASEGEHQAQQQPPQGEKDHQQSESARQEQQSEKTQQGAECESGAGGDDDRVCKKCVGDACGGDGVEETEKVETIA